jgi:hypothetical protein
VRTKLLQHSMLVRVAEEPSDVESRAIARATARARRVGACSAFGRARQGSTLLRLSELPTVL